MQLRKPSKKPRARLLVPTIILLTLAVAIVSGSVYLRWREAEQARLRLRIRQIRVEVLNGTQTDRLGQQAAERLRRAGFDVVDVDNAENRDFPETVVVDRADNRASNAALVAKALRCKNVIPQLEPTLLLEVTVIIGQDYLTQKKKGFLGIL